MVDLEVCSTHFLYEHRDDCNTIAMSQIFILSFSFFFTYHVWWSGVFGMFVALIGWYGSIMPVVQNKVSYIQFVSLGQFSWFKHSSYLLRSITMAFISFSYCN